jgi:hypothetical protein
MTQSIFFQQENGSVGWIIPALDCGIKLEEIARKDTPAGKPYIIVDNDVIPTDETFFEAWEADFSNPDGYGIGPAAWFIEQYQAELETLDVEKDQERIEELNRMIAVQEAELQK